MLEGIWIATSAELGGVALPPAVLGTLRLVLQGGQYALGNDHGTYRVDERASPAAIDVAGADGPNSGRQIPAIFEIANNMLRICYDLSLSARPTAFQSPAGSKIFLVTFRHE